MKVKLIIVYLPFSLLCRSKELSEEIRSAINPIFAIINDITIVCVILVKCDGGTVLISCLDDG